jgi:DNA-binding GntR family transcriptional regulator
MRLLLEREALRQIDWPPPEVVDEWERVVDDIEQQARAGRPDIAMEQLTEFYLGIYQLSPKKLIVEEIRRLWVRTAAYRALNLDVSRDPGRPGQRLRQIVDLVRARDLDRLRESMLRPTLRGQAGIGLDGGAAVPEADGATAG